MLSGIYRRGRDNNRGVRVTTCWLCGLAAGLGLFTAVVVRAEPAAKSKAADPKLAQAKAADAKPAEQKPADAKPGEVKPAEVAPTAVKPVTGPAGAPDPATVAARGKVISAAMLALTKEYQAYLKDPKSAKIREKSDYFKENKNPEATPDAIMRGLEQSVSGGHDVEAYVKWQLLSGIVGNFPPELNKRAVAVYRRAPAPFEHPGLDRRGLASVTARATKADVATVQKEFSAVVEKVSEKNKPILEYRDELFARLIKDGDAMAAGLGDVADRAGAGLNAGKVFDNVSAGIRSWSLSGVPAATTRGMADRVAALRDAVSRDDSKPYTKFAENKDPKKGPAWQSDSTLDVKKIDALLQFLNDTASSPTGGGLKFKPGK